MLFPRSKAILVLVFVSAAVAVAIGGPYIGATTESIAEAAKPNYKEFPHNAKAHQIECSSCHKFPSDNWNKVRTGTDAFPDATEYPRHESCLKCHMQQFFKGAKPNICSICHTNPSPRDSTRHPFPNPREIYDASPKGKTATSDFVVGFPHDKHIDIVAGHNSKSRIFVNAAFTSVRKPFAEESCSVCHKTVLPQDKSDDEYVTKPPATIGDGFWLKKGTFKSAPTGHTTCFTCHSADTGILPAPQTCAACHQLKPPQPAGDFDAKFAATLGIDNKMMFDSWRRRSSAGTFRHEWFSHAELSCATCHNVLKMDTAKAETTKVGIASCAACHATPTSDDGGALNYEIDSRAKTPTFQCVKCHMTFGKMAIPSSHTDAIKAAATVK